MCPYKHVDTNFIHIINVYIYTPPNIYLFTAAKRTYFGIAKSGSGSGVANAAALALALALALDQDLDLDLALKAEAEADAEAGAEAEAAKAAMRRGAAARERMVRIGGQFSIILRIPRDRSIGSEGRCQRLAFEVCIKILRARS